MKTQEAKQIGTAPPGYATGGYINFQTTDQKEFIPYAIRREYELNELENERSKDIDKDKWFIIGMVLGSILTLSVLALISLIR